MGRIYDVKPGPGERKGGGKVVYHVGPQGGVSGELGFVVRVEFDDDADDGDATVTAFVADKDGHLFLAPGGREAVKATFRARVRVRDRVAPAEHLAPILVGDA